MEFTKRIFNEAVDLDLSSENTDEIYCVISEHLGIDDIIGIFQVSKNSMLYDALMKWYEYKGIDPVDYEDNDAIYFTHGCNYAIYDDLVGGNGSSEAQKEFLDFLNK
ncbi:hypothetical protein SY212_04240 [Ligilactobacillus agilis]|uniref:Uncharacterized protein n=1 Tax=Ligilactobacillus agilis TaxID=1601 RepID=A0A6F9XJF8_9LACO|nr:hypothetical protein [Ligilactobacillus agilis]GET05394.1 hypothetical protein SY212_04240 [Ligilactobacillus agilis]